MLRVKPLVLLFVIAGAACAQNYTARQETVNGVSVVHLADKVRGMEVSILPGLGNRAYEFKIHGKNVLYFPFANVADSAKRPGLNGIPFLAPWGNRLDSLGFWANDKHYTFNESLGNVRGPLPIHGLLSTSSLWTVTEVKADKKSAHVTSRLDFWRHPELMAQWPFAHEYEMTYRLADGALQVTATIRNSSADAMPVAIGFHPYYQIPDVSRDEWTVQVPARQHVETDSRLIPTGELKPAGFSGPFSMKGRIFDDGFTDLERDSEGHAHFAVSAGARKVEVVFGEKYPVAIVWAPPMPVGQTRDFICFEPMAGITDALNLHHEGKYAPLQSIQPGGSWTESFWVRPTGF